MKRASLLFVLTITLATFASVIPSARNRAAAGGARAAVSSPGPSIVSVSGRQLTVRKRNPNGTLASPSLYAIRGVDWSPARAQTNTSPTDPNNVEVRRQEFQPAAATDIPLIKNMNANTARLYMDPPLDGNGLAVLDQLYNNDIMVVMTVDNGNLDIAHVQQAVTFYKDHPAILMWSLGNEWNINPPMPIAQIADQIEQEAALIKTLDGNHPVATSYGEIDINSAGAHLADTENYVNHRCRSVDVWALNIFRGNSFGTLFEQWGLLTSKPMMIGEFGTDAFRSFSLSVPPPGVVDETMQAQWVLSEWDHLATNLSANNPAKVALGGFVFEFNDEWWKVPTPFGMQTSDGCGPPNCANHPDNFANEEYFGIVTIDRQPRALYNTLATAFQPGYQPQSLTVRATSRGADAQENNFQNGVARFYKQGALFYQRTGGAGGGRGFNVAAINPCTGELLQPAQNYDTWDSSHNSNGSLFCTISSFLDGLPNGALVMMSVADEAGLDQFPPNGCTALGHACVEPFLQKLTQEYHSTMIRNYCYRNSWALIAVKGEAAARAEQLSSGGEATAQATLPVMTSLSPTSQFFPPAGGGGSVNVTAPGGCAWTASSNVSWITVTTMGGTGSGAASYSVNANPDTNLRAGTITVAGQAFVVSQAKAFAPGPPRGNLDSDNKTDITFYRNGLWGVLQSSQNFSSDHSRFFDWGGSGLLPLIGDFDGDGQADLAYMIPPAGGQSAAYAILKSTTNYDFHVSQFVPAGFPSLGDTPVVGDFDGDGRADPGIWRASQAVWIVPLSSTNYTTYLFAQWGQPGDVPVVGDFDGDGRADFGFYRNGLWDIRLSTNAYSLANRLFFFWGGAGLPPIVADFDGDHKADAAYVVPPSGGQSATYAIVKSSSNYSSGQAQFVPAGFPSLGDTPVVGDYDGDGKMDPGIWRATQGVWIIPLSSSNYASYRFAQWGQPGDTAIPNTLNQQ
jgi:Interleukin-like EMT inducer/Glycosyl hydrolases family 2, TIM barrel domain/Viral BACON domain